MGDNELSQDDIDALFPGEGEGTPLERGPEPPEVPAEEAGSEEISEEPEEGLRTSTAVEGPPEEKPLAQPVEFGQLQKKVATAENNISFLLDVPLLISVELGRTRMLIKHVLNLGAGSVVELSKLAGEPVDLLINNKLVARGEVVVINENFGVKIIDIISPEQRIRNLS
jgi:flagellar motor switch protein FliN/FliY